MSLKINFDKPLEFEPQKFSSLNKVCGLYFIFLPKRKISYPFAESRLLYIGMSEKITNSISNRMTSHYEGKANNFGLRNYRDRDGLLFTYLNFESLKTFWDLRIEDLESVFILDFVKTFGVYPICNNKTGFPELTKDQANLLEIDWEYFNQ